ncbi:hypothetical protein PspLS_04365 [Pyricularia sp. CBS 133598]|nr:hypothetical protein PspLS_04365 [Pyricularia sp. CBS 133598]
MQFSTIIATIFVAATGAVALPAEVQERQVPYVPCTGLYSNAQCCATDVLGLANLDCGQPPSAPEDADNFSAVCAEIGQRARCCVLPILDQGVLCNTPAGVSD